MTMFCNGRPTGTFDLDNRDIAETLRYQEARIEALQRRVKELEAENAALKARWLAPIEREAELDTLSSRKVSH